MANCRGALPSGFDFSSTVDVAGKMDRAFAWSDFTVRILSFDSSVFDLEKQTLQVVWKGNQVQVQKIEDRSPIDLGVTADLDQKQMTVSFQTDGLRRGQPGAVLQAAWRGSIPGSRLRSRRLAISPIHFPAASLSYQVGVSVSFQDQLPVHDLTLDTTFSGHRKRSLILSASRFLPRRQPPVRREHPYDTFYPEGVLTLVNVDAGTGHARERRADHPEQGRRARRQRATPAHGRSRASMIFPLPLPPTPRGPLSPSSHLSRTRQAGTFPPRASCGCTGPFAARSRQTRDQRTSSPGITLSATLRDVPPDKLYHLLMGAGPLTGQQEDIKSMLARYGVSANLELATDLSTVTVKSDQVTVTQADDPTTHLRFSALVDSSHVAVNNLSGSYKGYTLAGSLAASFAEEGQVGFSSDVSLLGVPFSLKGRYSEAGGLYAAGSYGLEVLAAPNRDGTYSLQARGSRASHSLRQRTAPSGTTPAVSFDASGLYSGPGEWVLRRRHSRSSTCLSWSRGRTRSSFSGRITPRRGWRWADHFHGRILHPHRLSAGIPRHGGRTPSTRSS